jgi:type VI secretion system protein ImpC
LWVRAGYYLAARITAAFVRTGWCTDIRGIGGGLVENLPVHVFVNDDGEIAIKVPTEVALDDQHEMALSRAGCCALMYARGRDMAAFFSVPTVHEPPAAPGQEPALAGRLAAGLDCLLAVVRTAHHVHEQAAAAMREHRDPARVAADVNAWIAQFVADDPGEGAPLAEAAIELTGNPDRPGEHLLLCALAPWLNGAAPDAVTVVLELAR